MNRLLLLFSLSIVSLHSYGQEDGSKSLHYYIETAKENSPLIADYRNRTEIEQAELERLKAMYTHSRLELNGDYLFVPIVSKDGGRAALYEREKIDLLPERCREIFLLHLEGYDNDAIAKKLSLSIETVKTQKKRAMKTLRNNLKEKLQKKYPDTSFFILFLYLDLYL